MDDIAHHDRAYGRGGAAQVFQALRDDITALRLAPGAPLSRPGLQERFGLSSTPIRDALLRLQEEGLVEVFPQHATRVAPIDIVSARQGQFLRRAIEADLVRGLAGQPDAAVVERLRRLIRQQTALARLGEDEALVEADHAFHRLFYDAAGMPQLWTLVRRQGGHIERLRRLNLPVRERRREMLRDHEAILDAIAAGRPAEAEQALRVHLSRSLDFVDELRAAYPGYFRR